MALLRWADMRQWIDGVPTVSREMVGEMERPRDRTLTDDEISELWKVSKQIGELSGVFLRLILLIGQRRDRWCGFKYPATKISHRLTVGFASDSVAKLDCWGMHEMA